MAFASKKKGKFEILEELYDDSSSIAKPKNPIKSYFADSKNVEKFLSGAILSVGLAAVVLGFFQLRGDVGLSRYQKTLANKIVAAAEPDLLGLKQKDTDFDGLNDYDELYTYATSPYLKDSDSDGINDAQELNRGSDPNCPEGQNCFAVWSDDTADTGAGTVAIDALYSNALSAAQVRELLRQNGMSQADLDQYSDAELLNAYQQIVSQQGLNQTTPATTKPVSLSLADISQLTPAEIRQLLVTEAGISQATVNQISDEDLMTLVKEILANQSGVVGTAAPADSLNLSQLQNLSPAEIRRQLAAAGISQSVLDETSDADLLNLVSEILANK